MLTFKITDEVEKYAKAHLELVLKRVNSPKNTVLKDESYFNLVLSEVFKVEPKVTLRSIVTAKPKDLEAFLSDVDSEAKKKRFDDVRKEPDNPKNLEMGPSEAALQFERLYDLLSEKVKIPSLNFNGTWRHIFFRMWSFSTCPYCNRNIMQIVEDGKDSWQSGDLDHVIPKKKNPMFCVSFYNLIPACKVCNFFKNEKHDLFPNPYDSRYAITRQFRFGIGKIKSGFPMKEGSFEISQKIDPAVKSEGAGERINNLLTICRIGEQYKQHIDVAQEVVQKEFVFNKTYREELLERYRDSLFKDKADLDRALFGRYSSDDELHRRPLSKLIRDIQDHLNGDADWMEEIPEDDLKDIKGMII